MSTREPGRIDRRTAEHLLRQEPMGIRDGHPPLAALLTAATVPGRPDELASEQTIAAAFRTAHLSPAPQPGRLSVIKTALLKLLTVKILAVAAATTAAGGVALAASTGALPNPLTQPAPAASTGLSAPHPTATRSGEEHKPGDAEASKDAKDADGSKAPSPSLVGLCHAYNAGNKTERGKALDNPAFTALITTAGGKDKVELFCHALLTAPTPASSSAQAGEKADKDHPTGAPTGHSDHTAAPGASPKR
jgi:hypothetical protein